MKEMIKPIVTITLIFLTTAFALLTIERVMMDYNENGVYFDGLATYNSDAVVAYGSVTCVLLVITAGIILISRKIHRRKDG
jgi:hypothetical protein